MDQKLTECRRMSKNYVLFVHNFQVIFNRSGGKQKKVSEKTGKVRAEPAGRVGQAETRRLRGTAPRVPWAPGGPVTKLRGARSRLHRSRSLQGNMRLKARAEIYTMHSFAQKKRVTHDFFLVSPKCAQVSKVKIGAPPPREGKRYSLPQRPSHARQKIPALKSNFF